jgi:hypothetical protein
LDTSLITTVLTLPIALPITVILALLTSRKNKIQDNFLQLGLLCGFLLVICKPFPACSLSTWELLAF